MERINEREGEMYQTKMSGKEYKTVQNFHSRNKNLFEPIRKQCSKIVTNPTSIKASS
jgi:hypothetical protein